MQATLTLDTDRLAALIRRKRECLVEIHAMGLRQRELIDAGSMTALLDVLATKQRVLGHLQQVERAMDPFRGQDPDSRRWRSPDDRLRTADDLRACETLLAEILRQEKESEREMIRRRNETAAQLRNVQSAAEARLAYAEPAARPSGRLDLTSEM